MNFIKSMVEKQYAYHKLDANAASLNGKHPVNCILSV